MSTQRRNIITLLAFLTIIIAVFAMVQPAWNTRPQEITVDELQKLLAQGDTALVLLDVRTPEEYQSATGHLKGSLLIPVQELDERVEELEPYRGKTIVAYCRTGRRSSHAADLLQREGFTALNLAGGIQVWNAKSLPVEKDGNQ